MANEQLKIVLTADTKQAQKALNDFVASTKGLSTEIPKLNKAVGGTSATLINFGRVIQDAPFGLIGIANNIDPLIQSFNSLSASSGGAKNAFKSLGAALIGPAGIAIAVSAVTSVFIKYGDEIINAINGISKLDQALIDAGKSGAESFAKANSEFGKFQQTLTSVNSSQLAQKQALEGVNKLLGEYGLQIESVAAFQKVAGKVGIIYAQIKQREAESTALASLAAKEYAENLKRQNDAGKASAEILGVNQGFFERLFKGGLAAGNVAGLAAALDNVADSKLFQTQLQDKTKLINEEINLLVDELNGVPGVNEKVDKSTKKLTKSITDNKKALEERNKAIKEAKDLLARAEQAFFIPFGQDNTPIQAAPEITDNVPDLKDTPLGKLIDKIKKDSDDIQKRFGSIPKFLTDSIIAANTSLEKGVNVEAIEKILGKLSNVVQGFQLLGPLIDQTFNALANGENAFDALIQGVKRLIVELLKAAALALILAAVSGGTGGGAAGGGFLNIFKSLLGFGKRAGGGPVVGGSPFLVGENGPELFVPGSSGRIVNNGNLMMGGGSLVARVSGNDLLFLMSKANNNRNAF